MYLDSEIESQEVNTNLHTLLVTIKLKILDVVGQSKGDDVMAIARIVSEEAVQDIEDKVRQTWSLPDVADLMFDVYIHIT